MALSLGETIAELGSAIDGLRLREGAGGTLVIDGVDPHSWFVTWQNLRDALPRTGRFPIAMASDRETPDEQIGDVTPTHVTVDRAAVEATDPWAMFDARRYFSDEVAPDDVRLYVPKGSEELAEQAIRELTSPVTIRSINRWVYDLLRQRPDLVADSDVTWTVSPTLWDAPAEVSLVLLPTPDPWMAGCWHPLWGYWGEEGGYALQAAEREWHAKWGAERAGSWGLRLEFVVARPPTGHEEAWSLAEQILMFAIHNDMDLWRLARALPLGRHWHLYNRP